MLCVNEMSNNKRELEFVSTLPTKTYTTLTTYIFENLFFKTCIEKTLNSLHLFPNLFPTKPYFYFIDLRQSDSPEMQSTFYEEHDFHRQRAERVVCLPQPPMEIIMRNSKTDSIPTSFVRRVFGFFYSKFK